MLWNLAIFALVGLFAGGAARLFYPGRQPMQVLATMTIGVAGALLGGLISWAIWPAVEGQVSSGGLLMSLLGAGLGLAGWAGVAYARRIS